MFGPKPISGKDLLKLVNTRLARTGTGSQSHFTADVRHGTVTLSGTLNFAIQRNAIVKAASRTAGVPQVIDQMQLVTKERWMNEPRCRWTGREVSPLMHVRLN